MSMLPLNLASRPFRNERLPSLLLALGFTVAGAVSIRHGLAVRALMPGRTSGLAQQVRQLEDEGAKLRAETASLRAPRPEPTAVAQWALLKDLVDRRTFAWSSLFAVLEEALPKGVRLVSISPSVEKGQMTVGLTAIARSNDDVLELIRVLEARPEFDDVLPVNRSGEAELNFNVTMRYTPRPAAAVASAAGGSASSPSPAAPGASPGLPVAGGSPSPAGLGEATAPGGSASSAAGSAAGTERAPGTGSAPTGGGDPTGSASGTGSASAAGTGSAGAGRGRPVRGRQGRPRESYQ